MSAVSLVRSAAILALLAGSTAGCATPVDVKEAIQVTDGVAGWYDGGIKEGKNRIVPMVSFRLQRQSEVNIDSVALNVAFRHPAVQGGAEEDWDEVFVQQARFSEGTRTAPIVVRAEKGYTGDAPQSRTDLFKNSLFRDVRAHVYAKYGSAQWVHVGTIDVPRQLITR